MVSLTKEMVAKMVREHGFYLEKDDDPDLGTLHIRHLACPDAKLGRIQSMDATIAKSLTEFAGGTQVVWIMYDDTLAEPKIHNALQNLIVKIRQESEEKVQERVTNVKSYFNTRKAAKWREAEYIRIIKEKLAIFDRPEL
jgi:hypothetical protein